MKEMYKSSTTDIVDLKGKGLLSASFDGTRTDYDDPIPISIEDSVIDLLLLN